MMDMFIVNLVFIPHGIFSAKEGHITFTSGENMLRGEIDSGVWAVSYLLSMYTYRAKRFCDLSARGGKARRRHVQPV